MYVSDFFILMIHLPVIIYNGIAVFFMNDFLEKILENSVHIHVCKKTAIRVLMLSPFPVMGIRYKQSVYSCVFVFICFNYIVFNDFS